MALNILNILLGVGNIVLFALWWSMSDIEVANGATATAFQVDGLTFSLAIFEALVAVVALSLVGLAFVGFSEIRNAAERRAAQTARQVVDREIRRFNRERARDTGDQPSIKATPAARFRAAGTEDAEEFGEDWA